MMYTLSSYECDHAALPRISVNADFSTTLKCLVSRGSIEDVVGWPGVLGDMEGLSS